MPTRTGTWKFVVVLAVSGLGTLAASTNSSSLNHSDRSTVTFQESPVIGSIRILRCRNFSMTSAFVRR